MIVIIDYGMGNLRSAQKGLEKAGYDAIISDDPADLNSAAGVVLPGVGAFKDCYDGLHARGFVDAVHEVVAAEKPLLGICVGMQLLFDYGVEGDGSEGLGIIPGRVVRFAPSSETGLKVPHIGWNRVRPVAGNPCPLLADFDSARYMYFVHSYFPQPENPTHVYATTDYGMDFPSVVGRDNVFGTQFHPEKSQHAGIALLRAFGRYVASSSTRTSVSR